jgi:quercetin dioxygenase-like cupin family protein
VYPARAGQVVNVVDLHDCAWQDRRCSTTLTIGGTVPVITAPPAPTHDLGGARFTSLATPSRGSTDTAVWRVEILPGTPPTPHSLTREEVFVVLAGTAAVSIDGVDARAEAGDVIVVPAGVELALANGGDEALAMLCCLPVGGQARTADGHLFTPPWAE